MLVNAKNPDYSLRYPDWRLMGDCYKGERAVKEAGQIYLPPTASMEIDGMSAGSRGLERYKAYRLRAPFHAFVAAAVETMLGRMHKEPATIELPAAMEPMRENATRNGEGLQMLLRRINERQLVDGRIGLLADLPIVEDPENPLPYLASYEASRIINWDDGGRSSGSRTRLTLVVVDETEQMRQSAFEWNEVERYRVLSLGSVLPDDPDGFGGGVYQQGVFTPTSSAERNAPAFTQEMMAEPSFRGRMLDRIPFVIINAADLDAATDEPPLMPLARLALSIYRSEADYRQALHMQGQDTLVLVGAVGAGDEETRAGAGAVIALPVGGDAKFIGVASTGLAEQRAAIENDKRAAMTMAAQLMDTMGGSEQSGEALQTRVAASTAALPQIAKAGAEGLQSLLRTVAGWVGADPSQVIVEPNLDFGDIQEAAKQLIDLMAAKNAGAPIALETIHEHAQQLGITERAFDEEMGLIDGEAPLIGDPSGRGEPEEDRA